MKYCPACNFSFPDFHHVCDFDGTELVTEPERQALVKVRPARLRSALKSPAFLSVLLAIVLLSSAIIIGYLENKSLRVATNYPAAGAPGDVSSVVTGEKRPSHVIRRVAHPLHNHQRNLNKFTPWAARLRQETASPAKRHQKPMASAPAKPEIARSNNAQQSAVRTPLSSTSVARTSQVPPRTSSSRNTDFAANRSFEMPAHQKEPKLTAMFKTTWHVLKKPFKF
jgi:hypothetical protein